MNIFSSIRYVALIAMLLISQVGSAYVFAPAMQDCGMDMAMLDDVANADHAMPMMEEANNGNSNGGMDCCDPAMMSSSLTSCCDAQCQCASFASSVYLSSEKPLSKPSHQAENPVIQRVTAIHTPFLQQPKRPPIRNYS